MSLSAQHRELAALAVSQPGDTALDSSEFLHAAVTRLLTGDPGNRPARNQESEINRDIDALCTWLARPQAWQELSTMGPVRLALSVGISHGSAQRMIAAGWLAKFWQPARPLGPIIRGPAAVFWELGPRIGHLPQEVLCSVVLATGGRLLAVEEVARGTADRVVAHPRDVFAPVLTAGGSALVLCHNHPSGSCQPSPLDLLFTQRMHQVARVLGVSLLDHIIVTEHDYLSLAEWRGGTDWQPAVRRRQPRRK